jgi:hypothetical protein
MESVDPLPYRKPSRLCWRSELKAYVVSICLLLCVASGLACAGPSGALTQWNPSESWEGGSQYDPRLDKPVSFWGAGIPLEQVFASVREQTGVEIGFDPSGEVFGRVCVNLYLNPQQPPTLRPLMAQLSWATDCAIGTTGEGAARRYALLVPSGGERVVEKLKQLDPERMKADAVVREATERLPDAVAMLPELREALKLSSADAIAQYLGKNDRLLLTLLDPSQRAAAQILTSLSEEEVASIAAASGFRRTWEAWTPEQLGCLRELTRQSLISESGGRAEVAAHVDDPEWLKRHKLSIHVWGGQIGGFSAQVLSGLPRSERDPAALGLEPTVSFGLLDNSHGPIEPVAAVRLRRLMGEPMSDEEVERLISTQLEWAANEALRNQLRGRIAAERVLSDESERMLSSLPLPLKSSELYHLWQVQETVAKASGLNVVSDCFWQPTRATESVSQLLDSSGDAAVSALTALTGACTGMSDRSGLADSDPADAAAVSWEWGDAGSFLRFRSVDRDVWRAAFLPASTIAAVDKLLAPALARKAEQQQTITISVAPREWAALIARLSLEQERWGGNLIYGDPTDPVAAYRQGLLRELRHRSFDEGTPVRAFAPSIYRLLSWLSSDQWAKLESAGLVWGKDISLHPSGEERRVVARYQYQQGDVFRLGSPEIGPEEGQIAAFQRLKVIPKTRSARGRFEVYWLPTEFRLSLPRAQPQAIDRTTTKRRNE